MKDLKYHNQLKTKIMSLADWVISSNKKPSTDKTVAKAHDIWNNWANYHFSDPQKLQNNKSQALEQDSQELAELILKDKYFDALITKAKEILNFIKKTEKVR